MFKEFRNFWILLLLISFTALIGTQTRADTIVYPTTGQTSAQTQVDTYHTSRFYLIASDNHTSIGGANLTIKLGPQTNTPITVTLYSDSSMSTILASKSIPATGVTQNYTATYFYFNSPVHMSPGNAYYMTVTSSAANSQNQAYFIDRKSTRLNSSH